MNQSACKGGFAGRSSVGCGAQAEDPTSSLIAAIYDAALDPSQWPAVLGATAKYIGGSSAGLWIKNPNIEPSEQYHFGGEDEGAAAVLTQRQGHRRPSCHRNASSENILIDRAAAAPGAFLEAHLSPQAGWETGGEDDWCGHLTVFRNDGCWDDEPMRRLRIIAPHLGRAVEMAKIISSKRAAAAAIADMLDKLNASIFLVDENGETVHANATGEARLAQGRVARSVCGTLTASASEAISALRRAHALKYHRPVRFSVTDAAAQRDAGGTGCHIAHMFPVEANAARARGCHRPVVAGLVLDEAILHANDPVDRIARHYGLARSEREVLLAIAEGCGLREIAERLSISQSTLKTYLRRLFNKTGTSRQMELVKLCAAFRSPFSG